MTHDMPLWQRAQGQDPSPFRCTSNMRHGVKGRFRGGAEIQSPFLLESHQESDPLRFSAEISFPPPNSPSPTPPKSSPKLPPFSASAFASDRQAQPFNLPLTSASDLVPLPGDLTWSSLRQYHVAENVRGCPWDIVRHR